MKKSVIATHALSLAVSTAVMLAIQGCGESKPGRAAGSSLSRDVAKRSAGAAATVARGKVCEVEATGSMVPTFDDRAFVIVEQCAASDVRNGDIIVRKLAGRNVVHRALGDGTGARTRGDAASSEDSGTITDSELVGRAIGIVWAKEGRK